MPPPHCTYVFKKYNTKLKYIKSFEFSLLYLAYGAIIGGIAPNQVIARSELEVHREISTE